MTLGRSCILVLLAGFFSAAAAGTVPVYKDRWLARDKALHFAVSAAIAAGMYAGCRAGLGMDRDEAVMMVPVWTVTVGLAKEDHDLKIKGTGFSFRDLVADVLGLGAGLAGAMALDSSE